MNVIISFVGKIKLLVVFKAVLVWNDQHAAGNKGKRKKG